MQLQESQTFKMSMNVMFVICLLIGTFNTIRSDDNFVDQFKRDTKTGKLYTVETIDEDYHSGYTYELRSEFANFARSGRYRPNLNVAYNQRPASSETKSTTSAPVLGFGRFRGPYAPSDDEDYSVPEERNSTDYYNEQLSTTSESRVPTIGWGSYVTDKTTSPGGNKTKTKTKAKAKAKAKAKGRYNLNYSNKLSRRKVLAGNNRTMPGQKINFLITTDMVTEFEGCFCDQQSPALNSSATFPYSNMTCERDPSGLNRPAYCTCIGPSVIGVPTFPCSTKQIILWNTGLIELKAHTLQLYRNLSEIYLYKMKQLESIGTGAFAHMPRLKTIRIKLATQLKSIPPDTFLANLPRLMHLKVTHSALQALPYLPNPPQHIMTTIDFDYNQIQTLVSFSIKVKTESLNLEYNPIHTIENYAFNGSQIGKLSLKGSDKLITLEEDAFSGIVDLQELDLSYTSLKRLPSNGLDKLVVLRLLRTPSLKEIPSIYHLKSIKEAHLTYAFHCCAFRYPTHHDPIGFAQLKENIKKSYCEQNKTKDDLIDKSGLTSDSVMTTPDNLISTTPNSPPEQSPNVDTFPVSQREGIDSSKPISMKEFLSYTQRSSKLSGSDGGNIIKLSDVKLGLPAFQINKNICQDDLIIEVPEVKCYPEPDAFNPCEDVMGNDLIRFMACGVTIAALVGNSAVIVVLVSGRFGFNVSKFLMINLGIADLMMGVYLLNIVMIDFKSRGVYFNYAPEWQLENGCKIAGFLTVFASTLSIFTLATITLERLFAINYAIQLDRRLKLSIAIRAMICGWIYAIVMATLPLVGVNSYTKTSICLPMEHNTIADKVYLVALLSINGIAFILITASYVIMYVSIISQKTRATQNDMTIAKRMGLLVLTDGLCWVPVTFFGLTAMAGYPLIDVTKSKFLLVTFYPLNSCANPFLYAILTKQYRRDFFILISRYGLCKDQAMRYKNGPARNHLNNYHHHHHHRHRRAEVVRNPSDELIAQPNPRDPLNTVSPENGSCESANVQLHKCSCPTSHEEGQQPHHRYYCAVYHHFGESSREPTSSFHPHRQHYHSCSDIERTHNNREMKPNTSQEIVELHSDSHVQSISEAEHHRRHKRCHQEFICPKKFESHQHRQHQPELHDQESTEGKCEQQQQSHASKENSSDYSLAKNKSANDLDNIPAGPSQQPNKEDIFSLNSAKCSCRGLRERNHGTSRESSSVDQIHFMRNCQQHDDNYCTNCKFSGHVYYSHNTGSLQMRQMSDLGSKNKNNNKNSIIDMLGRLSITNLVKKNETRPGKLNSCCHAPEWSHQSSSSTSSNHDSHLQCHQYRSHYRKCQNLYTRGSERNSREFESGSIEETPYITNSIPIEEERKILQQALDENTTVQEAVAVVEELSSGARISKNSSNDSHKSHKNVD